MCNVHQLSETEKLLSKTEEILLCFTKHVTCHRDLTAFNLCLPNQEISFSLHLELTCQNIDKYTRSAKWGVGVKLIRLD